MNKQFLILCSTLLLLPLLSHAQKRKVDEIEKVELPCFTIIDTIEFHLPKGFKKGETYWYGKGFIKAYLSERGAHLVVICGSQHKIPTLKGKQYVVTYQNGSKREGKIRRTDYLWREEDFFGFIVYYTKVKEYEKELFDSIMDEIVTQVKKD